LKTGPGKAIAKIESSAPQVRGALIVDEKLDPVALDHRVSSLLFIQRHLVMQTGTTTFADLHPQTFSGGLLLRIKEMSELPRRFLGDLNHGDFKTTIRPSQVNRSRSRARPP